MGKKAKEDAGDEEQKLRIAIVKDDKCKPSKCRQECKKSCPVVRTGKECVIVDKTSKIANISEALCIGCNICVKKCPFEAIEIINLPKDLSSQTTHRYGPNSFKLHRLPNPRLGQVLGLVGTNGIGKSTALKVLAGKLQPNLGNYREPPSWKQVADHFRGSELQTFFNRLNSDKPEEKLKAGIKPQYVDQIPKQVPGTVEEVLARRDDLKIRDKLMDELELTKLKDRLVKDLSGGELQRFAIAVLSVMDVDVYMFDEPSSYLDVRQRLRAAQQIRKLQKDDNYIICVEHDLSVLDYLSDFVCCLWGHPGAYGVVTMPASVREGINIFLAGFVPTENMRFREVELNFRVADQLETKVDRDTSTEYPSITKKLGTFSLAVDQGSFNQAEIIVMLGQNGTGKTTFIRMLAGLLKPDEADVDMPRLNVSYKPQTISAKFEGTVKDLLLMKIRDAYMHPQFRTDVVKPMLIEQIEDLDVQHLSGGELQRVAIVLALGKPADIYLIDEPSAYLDVEQRIVAAKVIKRFIIHSRKTAFVVEHDFIMASYLADRVVVYEGTPGISTRALSPVPLIEGMNTFLEQLEITFRRDPTNWRPRINKMDSQKDQEQKASGNYFTQDDD